MGLTADMATERLTLNNQTVVCGEHGCVEEVDMLTSPRAEAAERFESDGSVASN